MAFNNALSHRSSTTPFLPSRVARSSSSVAHPSMVRRSRYGLMLMLIGVSYAILMAGLQSATWMANSQAETLAHHRRLLSHNLAADLVTFKNSVQNAVPKISSNGRPEHGLVCDGAIELRAIQQEIAELVRKKNQQEKVLMALDEDNKRCERLSLLSASDGRTVFPMSDLDRSSSSGSILYIVSYNEADNNQMKRFIHEFVETANDENLIQNGYVFVIPQEAEDSVIEFLHNGISQHVNLSQVSVLRSQWPLQNLEQGIIDTEWVRFHDCLHAMMWASQENEWWRTRSYVLCASSSLCRLKSNSEIAQFLRQNEGWHFVSYHDESVQKQPMSSLLPYQAGMNGNKHVNTSHRLHQHIFFRTSLRSEVRYDELAAFRSGPFPGKSSKSFSMLTPSAPFFLLDWRRFRPVLYSASWRPLLAHVYGTEAPLRLAISSALSLQAALREVAEEEVSKLAAQKSSIHLVRAMENRFVFNNDYIFANYALDRCPFGERSKKRSRPICRGDPCSIGREDIATLVYGEALFAVGARATDFHPPWDANGKATSVDPHAFERDSPCVDYASPSCYDGKLWELLCIAESMRRQEDPAWRIPLLHKKLKKYRANDATSRIAVGALQYDKAQPFPLEHDAPLWTS